jgi:hypothetical protein
MKLSNNIKYLSLLLVALSIGACKKTIDLVPTDSIIAETAYQTVGDLEAGTIGAYSALNYDNTYLIGGVMADEVRWTPDNNGRNYYGIHKWLHTSSDGDASRAWNNLWIVIDRVNRALEALPNIPATTATDIATRDRDKGELLALRAFAHFELYRWYSQSYASTALSIPYVTASGIANKPSRLTVGEVLTKVKTDLAEAKGLIPVSSTDIFRITKFGVSAMQARVALYEKDWAGALTYTNEAIAAKPLATIATFPGIWKDANTNEQLFDLKRTSVSNYIGLIWRDTNGDTFLSPSNKLINSFDKVNDVRYNTYILTDPSIASPKEKVQVIKYTGQSATIKYNNNKIFRTAEMYLIRAEAYALGATPDLINGALALNTLRASRITGFVPVVYASQKALTDDIALERFKELAFEGHRYFDLRRLGLDINRDAADITQSVAIGQNLPATNFRYILPIPQDEIFANPNVVQNPGYN